MEIKYSAQTILDKANQIFNINPRLGASLTEAAEKVQQQQESDAGGKVTGEETPTPTSTTAPAQPVSKALKGINPKLLEKIRAKVNLLYK